MTDYELFARAVELVCDGQHQTLEGIVGLVGLAYTINGNGKNRRVAKEVVLDRILRGHTLNTA